MNLDNNLEYLSYVLMQHQCAFTHKLLELYNYLLP